MLNRFLNNRKIEITMGPKHPAQINAPVGDIVQQPVVTLEAQVAEVTETLVTGTVQVMGAYMAMDTVRKILIHKFTR